LRGKAVRHDDMDPRVEVVLRELILQRASSADKCDCKYRERKKFQQEKGVDKKKQS
jgi:single-stranded DNA-specific DHH superfamily exonuclease